MEKEGEKVESDENPEIPPVLTDSKGENPPFTRILWDISPLEKLKFQITEQAVKSFSNVFNPRYNLTSRFTIELKRRCIGENHIILTIAGLTGSGKTTDALAIAKEIEGINAVPFLDNSENVEFTFENLLQRVAFLPKNSTIICDESVLQTGQGQVRERLEIMNLENTIRKFGLNIIWVYPYENVKHPTAHFHLKTIAMNKDLKLNKLALMFGEVYLGYIILNVGKILTSDLWKNYGVRKDKFIEDIRKRKGLRKDYSEIAKTLLTTLSINQFRLIKSLAGTKLFIRSLRNMENLTEGELDTFARYMLMYRDEFKKQRFPDEF